MNPIAATIEDADTILNGVCGGAPELGFTLPGWCTPDKARVLVRLAMNHPGRCVELGVHGGRSFVALAMGLRLAGRGRIDGIDSYSAADCLEGDQSEVDKKLWSQDTDYERLLKAAHDGIDRHCLLAQARILRLRGDIAVRTYADESIDLIHLDGNHSELVSCRDVAAWLPKMAKIATWVADDTNWPSMQKALGMLEAGGFRRTYQGAEGYWSVYSR
jgi:hypothetical protein